jgi:hypothetical protein
MGDNRASNGSRPGSYRVHTGRDRGSDPIADGRGNIAL